MKKLIMIALVAILGVAAKAQTPVTPEVRKEVESILAQTTSKSEFAETLKTEMSSSLSGLMSAEKINGMCDELADTLYPDIIDAAVTVYCDIFTVDEIKELNKLYSSPLGKKILDYGDRIEQIMTQALSTEDIQQKMMPIIMKYAQ